MTTDIDRMGGENPRVVFASHSGPQNLRRKARIRLYEGKDGDVRQKEDAVALRFRDSDLTATSITRSTLLRRGRLEIDAIP